MLDNNEILCKINSNETREFHPGIVHAFENFCTLSEYCANSIIWEKALVAAVCPMLMTILSENFVPSRPTMLHGLWETQYLSSNIRNGCVASKEQQNMDQYECKNKITENTTDLLKYFTRFFGTNMGWNCLWSDWLWLLKYKWIPK